MSVFLYALFVLSLFFPFYTYAVYPFHLRLLRKQSVIKGDVTPPVSLIVVGKGARAEKKSNEVKRISYPDFEVIRAESIPSGKEIAQHDILVFTDEETVLDNKAIRELLKPFSDPTVGCVVGQQTCKDGNSLFWKYENWVKTEESRIGCVSGVNDSIFAIRKELICNVPPAISNESFYITTLLSRSDKKIVFQPEAKSYEQKKDGINYSKHIRDAVGYWQVFFSLKRMLLPGKGSFVYICHRVMKWFVWLNMLAALISSGFLAAGNKIMLSVFLCQIIVYICLLIVSKTQVKLKPIHIVYYFVSLNLSYMFGFIQYLFKH